MVLPNVYRHVISHLGLNEQPSVDAFAKKDEHVVRRYWGPQGEKENAFDQNWNPERLLWCNPPYSKLQAVVDKMVAEQARMILIVPDWRNTSWWKQLQGFVRSWYFYPRGMNFFNCTASLVRRPSGVSGRTT